MENIPPVANVQVEVEVGVGSQPSTLAGESSSAAGRSKKKKGPVVVAFSGFKHNHPEFSLEARQTLEQMVVKLGGKVKNESEFDGNITHVVSPPNSRTVKTLAAVLTHKWLVGSKWVLDSLEEGAFVDEEPYGIHSNESPFRGRKFFLTDAFVKEHEKKESKLQNCKSLIVLFGKGEMIKDLSKADMVIRASGESATYAPSLIFTFRSPRALLTYPSFSLSLSLSFFCFYSSFPCPAVDWESFIDLIAGGGKLRA